ncbi:NhaC family Na+:H+ antiporter [Desulfitispora alkaliphila]
MAILTGSSWTTIGTIGVAAMGIGEGLGIPAGPIAGAIVSGAFFGDKLSPLSDSTNLTAAIVNVDLYDHIKHMLYTTLPAAIIALGLFTFMGFSLVDSGSSAVNARELQDYMQDNFNFSLWLLIPPIVIVAMIVMKAPPIPSLMAGVILGGIIQVFIQGQSVGDVFNYLYHGYSISTGQSDMDELLTRGGLESMYSVVILGIVSLGFGGIMNATGMLAVIVNKMKQFVKSQGRLVVTTMTTSIMVNIIGANQYLAVILPGQMYESCYKRLNLHRKNLTRALESGGTLTAPLIPWNTSGVFVLSVLSVDALAYAPVAFICWITMIVTAIFSFANITMENE